MTILLCGALNPPTVSYLLNERTALHWWENIIAMLASDFPNFVSKSIETGSAHWGHQNVNL